MHHTLEQILLRLPLLEHHRDSPGPNQTDQSFAKDFRQGQLNFLKPRHHESGTLSRDNYLKNVDMSVFDGVNIYGWIFLVERYFRIGGFFELEKFDWVLVHLAGDALGWYHWETNRLPFASWFHFKERLLLRFGNLRVKKFEDLSAQVSGLDDVKLEGIFLNGLRPEMQELVYMMRRQSLPELITVALSMETSTLRKVMQKELPFDYAAKKSLVYEG